MEQQLYNDIYHLPIADHRIYHGSCGQTKLKSSFIVDESKTTQIVDAKGNVRYRVILSSAAEEDKIGFKVEVVHYYPGDEENGGQVVLRIPEAEGELEFDCAKARYDFDTCVQRFDSLVHAETRDFKDIEIYKDKIKYHVLKPKCCAFCAFSREHCHHGGMPYLECHNPDNQQKFSYMVDCQPFPNQGAHRYCRLDGWQKLPWQEHIPQEYADYGYEHRKGRFRDDSVLNRIFPRVDYFGTCMNFKKTYERKPGHKCDCNRQEIEEATSDGDATSDDK